MNKVTLVTVLWSRDLDMHSNYIGYGTWVSGKTMIKNKTQTAVINILNLFIFIMT